MAKFKDYKNGFFGMFGLAVISKKELQELQDSAMFYEFKQAAKQFKGRAFKHVITAKEASLILGVNFTGGADDVQYHLLPDDVRLAFEKVWYKYKPEYKSGKSDCDNIAKDYQVQFNRFNQYLPTTLEFFVATSEGYFVWVKGSHKINVIINDKKQPVFIEPQTTIIHEYRKGTEIDI